MAAALQFGNDWGRWPRLRHESAPLVWAIWRDIEDGLLYVDIYAARDVKRDHLLDGDGLETADIAEARAAIEACENFDGDDGDVIQVAESCLDESRLADARDVMAERREAVA